MDTILETLPNIGDTVAFIISSLVLYKKYMDSVSWDIENIGNRTMLFIVRLSRFER